MIPCRRCSGRHPLGAHGVGTRVLVRDTGPRSDGLQAGTLGTVVLYRILAGAAHQEVHVRLRAKSKAVVVFTPCELVAAPSAAAPTYESLSREEFHARLRGSRSGQPERRGLPGRVVVRVLAAP